MTKGKHVILCVDDDADFLYSLKIILGDAYVVETAPSAEEGIEKYKALQPDFIFVDLMMEEVDSGVNFVKELRALGKTPPIFMLSSVGDGLNLCSDYTQLGLAGVLQKPIDPATVMATLKAKLSM